MAKLKPPTTLGSNGFKIAAFRIPERTLHLTFEGTQWAGVEVIARLGISVAIYLEIKRLVDTDDTMALTQVFGDSMLIAWNLVDANAEPIPTTGKGMNSLPDIGLALRIVNLWIQAVAGVTIPLEPPLNNGSMLAAASTALESK